MPTDWLRLLITYAIVFGSIIMAFSSTAAFYVAFSEGYWWGIPAGLALVALGIVVIGALIDKQVEDHDPPS